MRQTNLVPTNMEDEKCDHHWLTDVQLGDYVECELCGLIFLKKDWGSLIGENQENATKKV